ncbi:hypothetical protein [Engelhardtia mirabilis]|uniref:hypothetical protein n=1 Tax=Engelhardtia mirabilis TaxID=2528011 RepID=UPI003AF3B6C8
MTTSDRAALAVAAGYVLIAAPYAWMRDNSEFLMYVAVLVVIGAGVLALHRRVGLHPGAVWGLVAWGAMHLGGGLLRLADLGLADGGDEVLYGLWLVPGLLRYDQLVHALGFGLCTWLCWQGLRARLADPRPSFGLLLLCALGGMGLGAANEIVEFMAVLALPETGVGGYENTAWDLVFNFIGASVAGVAIGWRSKTARPSSAD